MASTLHRAVWDWLLTCPHIGDLFFNASRAEDGNTQLIPSDQIVREYIDGSTLRKYNVALTRFMAFSPDPNDVKNITDLIDFDKIGEWVETQVSSDNLPAFPSGYRIEDIKVLPNNSGYMTAQDFSFAKYMLEFEIEYTRG